MLLTVRFNGLLGVQDFTRRHPIRLARSACCSRSATLRSTARKRARSSFGSIGLPRLSQAPMLRPRAVFSTLVHTAVKKMIGMGSSDTRHDLGNARDRTRGPASSDSTRHSDQPAAPATTGMSGGPRGRHDVKTAAGSVVRTWRPSAVTCRGVRRMFVVGGPLGCAANHGFVWVWPLPSVGHRVGQSPPGG